MELSKSELCFGPYRLSEDLRCLLRGPDAIALTPTEYQLLLILLEARGKPVSKIELTRHMWGSTVVSENNLAQHVRSLRQKLGIREDGKPYIDTFFAFGYCLRDVPEPPNGCSAAPIPAQSSAPGPSLDSGGLPVHSQLPLLAGQIAPQPNQPKSKQLALRWYLPSLLIAISAATIVLVRMTHPISTTLEEHTSHSSVTDPVWEGPRLLRTIEVGGRLLRAALTPNERELYITKPSSNAVAIVDTRMNQVTATLPVGERPEPIAVAPDGSRVYVGQELGNLSVIDTATRRVSSIDTGGGPVKDIAMAPDGTKLYLAMGYSGLRRLDIRTGSVVTVSPTGYARALALAPDGRKLYIMYQAGGPGGSNGHDAIGYFDTRTDHFLGSASGFANVGECAAVSPDGSKLWEYAGDACDLPSYDHVGCPSVPAFIINVLSATDHKFLRTIAFPGTWIGCPTFLPNGTPLVAGSNSLFMLDPEKPRILASTTITTSSKVVITKDGSLAYAPGGDSGRVSVLQCAFRVRATLQDDQAASGDTVSLAILTTPDFEARSVDPNTLLLGGKAVQPTRLGMLQASLIPISGLSGEHLVVKFPITAVRGRSEVQLVGKTYAGLPISALVRVTN